MISVNIPTKGRKDSLVRCIKSIPDCFSINIYANCEDDVPKKILAKKNILSVNFDASLTPNQCHNIMASNCGNHFIPCCDDIEFMDNSIENAFALLEKLNLNGVVGFNQINIMTPSKTAIMLIGHDYYKDHGLFNLNYKHFYADTEFGEKAINIKKYLFCENAKIKHHQVMDKTYLDGRSEKIEHDQLLYKSRL